MDALGDSLTGFTRYVALGDSQTEGAGDLDAAGQPVGWADRFARALAETTCPGLTYANLAVGGCRSRHVREVQLPVALTLEPDLATVAVGMNDLLRHDFDLDAVSDDVDHALGALRARGAVVATMTYPDVAMMIPAMRWLRPREVRLNDRLREVAARHDALVLELFDKPMCGDPRMWSHDRIHASSEGHRRTAAGMAEVFGLPGSDHAWAELPADRPWSGRWAPWHVVRRDAWWAATWVVPFMARQLRNRPSGPRTAKRPALTPVLPALVQAPAASRPV